MLGYSRYGITAFEVSRYMELKNEADRPVTKHLKIMFTGLKGTHKEELSQKQTSLWVTFVLNKDNLGWTMWLVWLSWSLGMQAASQWIIHYGCHGYHSEVPSALMGNID